MTSAYGSTKQQAEKNASIKGLKWLAENRSEEIKNLLEQSKYNQSLRASFMQYCFSVALQLSRQREAHHMIMMSPSSIYSYLMFGLGSPREYLV